MIRRLTFASCYVYSPRGAGAASRRSRLLRKLLKAGDDRFFLKYALRVRQQFREDALLAGFLGAGQVLVPVPGSAPAVTGVLSVPEHLAMALVEAGLGRDIWKGLLRSRPVPKSATSPPLSRPTVGTHYESFAVAAAAVPARIVLIDDVVTKGRTLLAAAARLQDASPDSEIRAFALLRTMGWVGGVERLVNPCVGEIRWRAGDAYRNP